MVLEKTLECPLDTKEIKPVNLKEINTEYSLQGLLLNLKLQYLGHLMQKANSEKDPDVGKDWSQKKEVAEDEMDRYQQWT